MKDLSREEELRKRIYEMAEECSEKKWKRLKRTFLVIAGGLYLILQYNILKNGVNITDVESFFYSFIAPPLVAGVAAGFILLIAYGILYYIITGAMEEEKEIAELKGKWIERKYFINKE